MKNTLYFILLVAIFLSSNLFAIEQPEENINQEDVSKSNTDAEKTSPLLGELKESTDPTNVINEEVPSSNQTNLQSEEETNIKDTEFSISPLLEEKKEEPEEKKISHNNQTNLQSEEEISKKDTELLSTSQFTEKKKEEQPDNITPVNKKNEESEKWTKLNKEIKKHKSKSIYKRQYDSLNEHLPKTIFTDDYSKQFFYCIKKGNLICLRGVINKLEKIGLTIQEILRFRNKLGDTPLIYAVKQGQIDTVRFLLLQGADPRVVDNNFKSPIDIAIEKKQIDIINAIAEMMPYLLEDKEINNEEDSEMYNFAIKTKESTCDAKDN
ncbi:MAG: ankyrin repeat domain-containing protein [Wolbachia endosymbiont of Homalodisca vitripennis]|nr:ankyrin repeat domain-containing protein [Wolbachia endosymbiont of Homalodisca vitripennis]MCJ7454534.1 ankyrin repeat domain-containing protein [Wolbachia endosymbiont of Homalodisca vitripennis]MCJ7476346.1 ankyrin repeat domain-containing protein [Wolbachia endosymbiont of Homalodisca vitripennis]